MPGIVQQRRKRPSEQLSDDDENSDASSSGSKRPRFTRDASVESDDTLTANGGNSARRAQNGRDDEPSGDAHQPGSIVRVTLKNFVTYTAAEFLPGPSLNMVIGPNGTGKSTLVCAICLGLGWDPKNLGRAKEIGEFVKHGASEAVIEIELAKGRHHNTNPVIRRRILKEGNKSAFAVNGRQSSQKDVVRLAKSFSIQIDNLCQFLPQDRVVEFAGLSPVALLRETLRAAAPEEMVQWHEQLKELRSDEKRLEVEQKNTDEHFRLLQTKQKATEHDVRQWNERQELVTKAKALEKCRPIIESNVIKRQIGDIKNQRDVARAEAQQLQAEIAPTQEAVGEVESYRDQISEVKIQRKAHVDKATEMAKRLETNIKAKQEAIAEYGNQVDAEKSGEKERRKEVKRLEAAIAAIERDMQNAPVEVDEDSFKARLAEMRSEKSSADRRLTQVDTDMQGCQRRAGDIRRRRDETKSERARLNTQSGKQANILERISKDTAIGWRWVEEHRDELRFKGKVSGPPILTCSVTDQRFADIVETQFGGFSDATAITCTDSADARLLSNKLLGNEGPRLHQITIRTIPQSLAAYRPPVTREELQGYGFEGWILDYIQGPDEVLAMLCESAQLHRAAYSPKPLSNEQHSAAEQSPIQSWIAGREKYQVKKRYGQASTRVVQVKTSQFFTDRPIDAEQTRQLDDAIRDLERDTMELKEEHTALKVEQKKLNDGLAQVNNEMKELVKQQEAKRKARAEWQTLPTKKAQKQDELNAVLDLMRDTGNRILDLKAKSEQAALTAAAVTIDCAKAFSRVRQCHENLIEAEIRLIEADSELSSLKAENADILHALETKKQAAKTLEAEKKSLTAQYNRIITKVKQDMPSYTEEENEVIAEFSSLPTQDELNNEIETVTAKLGLMADGNPNAVKAYENREREIQRTEQRKEEIETGLQTTKNQITEIKEQWEPKVDELVEQISDGFSRNFDKIGCAGQVGVYKDEDFENWSIQIQVRFRENESLSILDSHRQSGGERAVSTIFYLMALQDLARSPFRVVDEINQGMDPRNERMVHERMVDIACQERTSQYFLITPKLLNDLKFHPKMKIHCIASGEHMPSDFRKMDFGKLADVALRRKVAAA